MKLATFHSRDSGLHSSQAKRWRWAPDASADAVGIEARSVMGSVLVALWLDRARTPALAQSPIASMQLHSIMGSSEGPEVYHSTSSSQCSRPNRSPPTSRWASMTAQHVAIASQVKRATCAPVLMSQSFSVLSHDAERARLPSGSDGTALISSVWPRRGDPCKGKAHRRGGFRTGIASQCAI